VSVLGVHQEQAGRQLSARSQDRFNDLDWHSTRYGAVLITGAAAWFETSIEQQIRAGDHDIVLLRVQEVHADHNIAPLVFHASQFRRLEAADSPR
jgi:flavin reductase (DIM6/NTAB) family NADH-FMN oxidoreductase RutF